MTPFWTWKKSIWPKKVLCPHVLFMNFSTSMHSTYIAIPNPILNSLLKITNCVRRENTFKPLWFLYPKPWSICQKSSGFLYDSLFIVFYNFRKSPRTFLLPLDEGRYNCRLARILIGQRTAQTFLSGIFTIYMMVHSPNVIQEIIDTL